MRVRRRAAWRKTTQLMRRMALMQPVKVSGLASDARSPKKRKAPALKAAVHAARLARMSADWARVGCTYGSPVLNVLW